MKKIKLITILLISFFTLMGNVEAASGTLSINRSSVELGQSVTASVTVSGAAAGIIRINGSGSTSNCSKVFEHGTATTVTNFTRTYSITCRSTSLGTITFRLSGDITPANGNTRNVSGTRTVTVVPVRPRSTNNNLSSLTISGIDITPNFASGTLTYSATSDKFIESVTVNAKAADNKARVTGTGKKNVTEGDNALKVTVTAENGSAKTYTINLIVPEKEPIIMHFNGQDFLISRKLPENIPLNFEKTTVTINDEEVEALYNELLDLTLVYARDEDNNSNFFIFEDDLLIRTFLAIQSEVSSIMLMNIDEVISGMTLVSLTINDNKIDAMQINEGSRFYIVKGIDILTNETNLYYYDRELQTLSLFDEEGYEKITNQVQIHDYMMPIIYGLAVAAIVQVLIIILLSSSKSKLKKRLIKMQEIIKKEPKKEVETKEKTKPKKK